MTLRKSGLGLNLLVALLGRAMAYSVKDPVDHVIKLQEPAPTLQVTMDQEKTKRPWLDKRSRPNPTKRRKGR